jgi:hypothetical protein
MENLLRRHRFALVASVIATSVASLQWPASAQLEQPRCRSVELICDCGGPEHNLKFIVGFLKETCVPSSLGGVCYTASTSTSGLCARYETSGCMGDIVEYTPCICDYEVATSGPLCSY